MHARLAIPKIPHFLSHYAYAVADDDLFARRERILSQKQMRLQDLYAVCDWKAPRAAGHARKNKSGEVQEITACALGARSERIRIEALQVLHGVNYPTASVILHFFHRDVYPILDFRALWSTGFKQPSQYTFEFWWRYVEATRDLLAKARRTLPWLSIRDLDRALWQYSHERQQRG
jgi:hypothetical protein